MTTEDESVQSDAPTTDSPTTSGMPIKRKVNSTGANNTQPTRPAGNPICVKSVKVWSCLNAELATHACDHSYCATCLHKFAPTRPTRKRKQKNADNVMISMAALANKKKVRVCDHANVSTFKEADIKYIVGDYTDSVRAQGAKTPTMCKGCFSRYYA